MFMDVCFYKNIKYKERKEQQSQILKNPNEKLDVKIWKLKEKKQTEQKQNIYEQKNSRQTEEDKFC